MPQCDEFLQKTIDFHFEARQFTELFDKLFISLRGANEFTPVYLAPKAIQKYLMNFILVAFYFFTYTKNIRVREYYEYSATIVVGTLCKRMG